MLSEGLVGYWSLNESAGKIVHDQSGFGKHGTLQNMNGDEWTDGKIHNALQINEKNDGIAIPSFGTTQISVVLWYYFNGTGGYWNTLVCRAGGSYHHLLIQTGTNLIGFYKTGVGFYSSGYSLVPGNWYHLIVMKNGTNSKIYVNAVKKQDSDSSFNNATYPVAVIGNYGAYTQGALGIIDEIRIYKRILTQDEISTLCNEPRIEEISFETHIRRNKPLDAYIKTLGIPFETHIKKNESFNAQIKTSERLFTHITRTKEFRE